MASKFILEASQKVRARYRATLDRLTGDSPEKRKEAAIKALEALNDSPEFIGVVADQGLAHFWSALSKAIKTDELDDLKAVLDKRIEEKK